MFTPTKLIPLLALIGCVFALPSPDTNDKTHAPAKRGGHTVRLNVDKYMSVHSAPKDENDKGWAGNGYAFWNFQFDGAGYMKETFNYTLYENDGKGNWNSSNAHPTQAVLGVLSCVIDAAPIAESATAYGAVTLLAQSPWLKTSGVGIKDASCTVISGFNTNGDKGKAVAATNNTDTGAKVDTYTLTSMGPPGHHS